MTDEKKSPKKNPFLPEERRLELIDQLEKMGIATAEMSDDEILAKSFQLLVEESEKRLKLETEKAILPLNSYCEGTHLRNKELLERLFRLNIPRVFLKIFEDEDIKLEDKDLWAIVRRSGVRQIEDPKEIFKNRSPIRPMPSIRAFNVSDAEMRRDRNRGR